MFCFYGKFIYINKVRGLKKWEFSLIFWICCGGFLLIVYLSFVESFLGDDDDDDDD